LAVAAVAFLAVNIAIDVVCAAACAVQTAQNSVSAEALDKSRSLISAAADWQLPLVVSTGVTFIAWMYIAARQADSRRADALRFRPSWAIWGWFVPFLNLARPAVMANDIWVAHRPPGHAARESRLVGWWWATLLCAGFSSNILMAAIPIASPLDAAWLGLVAVTLSVAAAILAIGVVVVLTSRMLSWRPDVLERQPLATTEPITSARATAPYEDEHRLDELWDRWMRADESGGSAQTT
jgi:hypothetical protein